MFGTKTSIKNKVLISLFALVALKKEDINQGEDANRRKDTRSCLVNRKTAKRGHFYPRIFCLFKADKSVRALFVSPLLIIFSFRLVVFQEAV